MAEEACALLNASSIPQSAHSISSRLIDVCARLYYSEHAGVLNILTVSPTSLRSRLALGLRDLFSTAPRIVTSHRRELTLSPRDNGNGGNGSGEDFAASSEAAPNRRTFFDSHEVRIDHLCVCA